MDAEGEDLWVKYLLTGQIFNVIQDSEGNIIVAGEAHHNSWPDGFSTPIRWNDQDLGTLNMNTEPCSSFSNGFNRTGYLAKLNPAGEMIWCTFLTGINYGDDNALDKGSSINDVVEHLGPNGIEYWAVGRTAHAGNGAAPFIVRVTAGGVRVDYQLYANGLFNGTLPNNWPGDQEGWFLSIAKDPLSGSFFATGILTGQPKIQAIGFLLHPGTSGYNPTGVQYTGQLFGQLQLAGHDPDQHQYAIGGGFVTTNGITRVIWPMPSNFEIGDPSSGRHSATLFVHGIDMAGNIEWTTNLGEVRAYDLQSEMCPTSDGKVAISSSKWARPYKLGGPLFRWTSLPNAAQNCLLNEFSYTNGNGSVDWPNTDLFDYWNTDAFVSKLDPTNGTVLWAAQWDADPANNFDCSDIPLNDIRNEECIFKITEAPDGDLIMSGTTSHNFDDMYLVKVRPGCQSNLSYQSLTLNNQGQYTLQTNETWNTDRNIYGTIVVPAGRTLTIQNARIGFADSEQLYWPTRIMVEPRGFLYLKAGAVLTSVEGCPNSMWDGIVVQGPRSASQEPNPTDHQGLIVMSGATIENARTGISVAGVMLTDETMAQASQHSSGGVVSASNSTFRNNVRDVLFTPYENFTPGNPYVLRMNRSRFYRCTFKTDAALNNERMAPKNHVSLFGVRGILFHGCTFRGSGPYAINTSTGPLNSDRFLGTGIYSLNSSFIVDGYCTSQVNNGELCPEEFIVRSTFEKLWYGVNASTFDFSRTFTVDRADLMDCLRGVRMEGIQDAGITRCTIHVGDAEYGDIPEPYGVYSDQCTGYEIEENAFTTSEQQNDSKIGLIIKDSGRNGNQFYNNSFDGFKVGSLIEGQNGDPNTDYTTGLEVKCNDYGQTLGNYLDVALLGSGVTVQRKQGLAMSNPFDPITNPAGNRFSNDHVGAGNPEEDWYVESANFMEYFFHTTNGPSRLKPSWSNSSEIILTESNGQWPGKELACPTRLSKGGIRYERRFTSQNENLAEEDAKDAYDATKDDGDTYTLEAYIWDPTKSSTQVRNALLSVAPKVSEAVWKAVFLREPALTDWHLTQALVGNSPLQGGVMERVKDSSLSPFYLEIIEAAQTGDINLLTLLESEIAAHAGLKAEALGDLGRLSWLDSTTTSTSLDSLLWWHQQLPATSNAMTKAGVYAAKGDHATLFSLAEAEKLFGNEPELYELIKRYAEIMDAGGWEAAEEGLIQYLDVLAQQRMVTGSAAAQAWLSALNNSRTEEVILLPNTMKSRNAAASRENDRTGTSKPSAILQAFPNPSAGPVYLVLDLPTEAEHITLAYQDALGRTISTTNVRTGTSIAEVVTTGWPNGMYNAVLQWNNSVLHTVRFSLVR